MNCLEHMQHTTIVSRTFEWGFFPGYRVNTQEPSLLITLHETWKVRCECCGTIELQKVSNYHTTQPFALFPAKDLLRELRRRFVGQARRLPLLHRRQPERLPYKEAA